MLHFPTANGFSGSVEIIKEELGKYLWKAVDEGEEEEIKTMLENCGAYVDEICHLEGYEGTSKDIGGFDELENFGRIAWW